MGTGDEITTSLLLDRYRVEGQRDDGDRGLVLRAYDTQAERLVEIHAPSRDAITTGIAQTRERFANEAEARVRIGARDDIVAVHDLVSGTDETPYLILEYVAGGTLAERLTQKGALSLADAVPIMQDAARALGAAHNAGIVHRDIRPATIMLTADGHAKLGGFSFAQIENSVRPVSTTPMPPEGARYRSPEQDQATEPARPPSDQYSFGLVLFEMLIGVAFKELTPDEAWARAAWQSPAVFACLKRMTMDNPAERYSSMTVVLEALDRIARMPASAAPSPAAVVAPPITVAGAMEGTGVHDTVPPVELRALRDAVVSETPPAPHPISPPPVLVAVEPPVVLPPRRTSRAWVGGLLLLLVLGTILLARGIGGGSRTSPNATATVTSAGTTETATTVPTQSTFATLVAQPTPTASIGTITALLPPASLSSATGGSAVASPSLPISPTVPVPPTTGTAMTPAGTQIAPGGMASAPAPTVSVATRAPEPTMPATPPPSPTMMPVPTVAPAPAPTSVPSVPAMPASAPTAISATPTPMPPLPTPIPILPGPAPVPSLAPPPSPPLTLGIQSVGTTNQPLAAIAPEDSVVRFPVGQEVFGWINFGGAVAGQDTLNAVVLAGGVTPVGTRQVTLMKSEGFAVFSFGSFPAGQYTLQVSYQGNVVRESTFVVGAGVPAPTTPPRAVPTAVPAAQLVVAAVVPSSLT